MGGRSVSSSVQSDWPKALWRCPLPNDVIPSNEEDTAVSVSYGNLSVNLTLTGGKGIEKSKDSVCFKSWPPLTGQREGWRLGEADRLFGSTLTAATSSVLEAELENCQELLQLEPNNKCTVAQSVVFRTSTCTPPSLPPPPSSLLPPRSPPLTHSTPQSAPGCILTTLLLMQALDSEANHQRISDMFTRLTQVDPYRHGYYQDMCKYIVCIISNEVLVEHKVNLW